MILQKLPITAAAAALLLLVAGGCSHDTWSYRAVPDTNISRPNQLDTRGALLIRSDAQAAAAASAPGRSSPDDVTTPGRRTVLVASWQHESTPYDGSMGRTLVIFLNGEPKPGQYWINADNAVLLSYSAYSTPTRERVNLEGSIKINHVDGKAVVAEVAVRDTTFVDSTNFLSRPWDPLNRTAPFLLKGQHTFALTTPNDPLFEQSAVKWVSTAQ
jgi:hypothetical protein